MSVNKKFYITTPIYYVNDLPHVGHAYSTIAADVLARYHRALGEDVFFLTGTDENSQKNAEAARRAGYTDIHAYVDMMSAKWQTAWDSLGLTHDDFIRTTEERHKKGVDKFFKTVWNKGDIYEGIYEGLYCAGCEAFVTESDLLDGFCPIHKKAPQKLKEKNLFFRLTKYRDALLKHIDAHPDFIQPESRRNEVASYIADFMSDISISRESAEWGIAVPETEDRRQKTGDRRSQVLYVWFDALINYLTAIGYGTDKKKFQKYWPADLHLVGKDIIKFHCALWPAMLMSADLPLPKHIFAHGFFTIDGQKISKSLGNVIDPFTIVKKHGVDALRYFLLREIRFGEDGNFSLKRLEERYNGDLANELGNAANRVLSMVERYLGGEVPEKVKGSAPAWERYRAAMERFALDEALETAWSLIREIDRMIDSKEPWKLAKTNRPILEEVLYTLLETLRHVSWMLWPFMPQTAEKIWQALGVDETAKKQNLLQAQKWGGLEPGTKIEKIAQLFPRTKSGNALD